MSSFLDLHTLGVVHIHASNKASEAARMMGDIQRASQVTLDPHDPYMRLRAERWEAARNAYEDIAAWAKRESAEAVDLVPMAAEPVQVIRHAADKAVPQ